MSRTNYEITPLYLGQMNHFEQSVQFYGMRYGQKEDSPFISYLIRGNGKTILVDTGPSDEATINKYHSYLDVTIPENALRSALAAEGVAPDDVDYIILSHLHWDHVYGNELFPGKKFYVQRTELHYGIDPAPIHINNYESPQSGIKTPFLSTVGQFILVDGDMQLEDGIELIFTPGHSPGSQCVLVNTEAGNYLITGDSFNKIENWTVPTAYSKHSISGIHVDVREYFKTLDKLDTYDITAILPGHDAKVFDRKVYGPINAFGAGNPGRG